MAYLNTPLNFQSIVAPHIGGTEQVFAESSKQLQDLYYANEAKDFERNLLFANAKTIEGDDSAKRKVGEEMDAILENVARDVKTGNMRYELAGNYIMDATRRMVTNQDFLNEQESYKNYIKARELQETLKAQGLNPLDFRPPTGWNTKEMGIFTSGVEAERNWKAVGESLFDKMMPDEVRYSLTNITDTQLEGALAGKTNIATGYSGISFNKIKNYVDNIYGLYEATPEGEQRFRNLTLLQGLDDDVAREQMKRELLSIGRELVHSKTQYAQTDDLIKLASLRGQRGGGENSPYGFGITTASAQNIPVSPKQITSLANKAIKEKDKDGFISQMNVFNAHLNQFLESNPNYKEAKKLEDGYLKDLRAKNPILAQLAQKTIHEAGRLSGPGLVTTIENNLLNFIPRQEAEKLVKDKEVQKLLNEYAYAGTSKLYNMYKDFNNFMEHQDYVVNTPLLIRQVGTKDAEFTAMKNFTDQFSIKNFNVVGLPTTIKAEDLDNITKMEFLGPFKDPVQGQGIVAQYQVTIGEGNNKKTGIVNLAPKANVYNEFAAELEKVYGNRLTIKNQVGQSNLNTNVPITEWNMLNTEVTPENDFYFTGKPGEYTAKNVKTGKDLTLGEIVDKLVPTYEARNNAIVEYALANGIIHQTHLDNPDPDIKRQVVEILNNVEKNTVFNNYSNIMTAIAPYTPYFKLPYTR